MIRVFMAAPDANGLGLPFGIAFLGHDDVAGGILVRAGRRGLGGPAAAPRQHRRPPPDAREDVRLSAPGHPGPVTPAARSRRGASPPGILRPGNLPLTPTR